MRWILDRHGADSDRSRESHASQVDSHESEEDVWWLEAIGRHAGLALTSRGILYAPPQLLRHADRSRFIAYGDIAAVESARGLTACSGKLLIYEHGGACTQIGGIRSGTVCHLAAVIESQLLDQR
jgi:hypothetical protein